MTKTILITGASTGIGLATVTCFLAQGYRVLATARKPEDLERLTALGAFALRLEMADEASVRACVAAVSEKTGGKLDLLLNNAAYGLPGVVEDLPIAALKHQFDVNVFGTILLTQLCLPLMRANGYGRVVFVSSMLGVVTLPARAAYCASKYALESLIAGLRMELKNQSIDVVSLRPGPIQSRFRQRAREEFQAHIDREHSDYQARYAAMDKQENLNKIPFSQPPEAVARLILKMMTVRKPRAHYDITVPSHLFGLLRRLLPESWLDRLLTLI